MSLLQVKVITPNDDLDTLVAEINKAEWDEANEMSIYDANSLATYLERQDTIFIVCHDCAGSQPVFMGMASSRIEIKPYGQERWLYVDEVDVCADQRQKGAGKLIMKTFLDIAKKQGCEEVWLGTETDNHSAKALYRSLDPGDESDFVGYTYEIEKN